MHNINILEFILTSMILELKILYNSLYYIVHMYYYIMYIYINSTEQRTFS